MKLIVITRPDFFTGEVDLVNNLFDDGLERLHLRKPKATKEELAKWIEGIAPPFRQSIVLHDCHELAAEYLLGGIHLNSRNPKPLQYNKAMSVSRSCHSIAEVKEYMDKVDYMFLSPIFDSISKEGYGATFTRNELEEARVEGLLGEKVYALGGVSVDKIPVVKEMGFCGAAILGDIWLSQNPRERFKEFTLR